MPSLGEIHGGGNFTPNTDKDLEFDAMQMHLAAELIGRVKRRHPDARLGLTLLFRGYLMRALDRLLPKDVWIANMENCGNGGPQMGYYRGIAGRDLIVIPRIVDDGCELHMQMNATMYDRDEIVTGAEAAGRGGHHRPARQGARRRVQHPLPGRRLLGRRGRRAVVLHRLPAAALRSGRGAARGRCVPSPGGCRARPGVVGAERDLHLLP